MRAPACAGAADQPQRQREQERPRSWTAKRTVPSGATVPLMTLPLSSVAQTDEVADAAILQRECLVEMVRPASSKTTSGGLALVHQVGVAHAVDGDRLPGSSVRRATLPIRASRAAWTLARATVWAMKARSTSCSSPMTSPG